MTARPDGEKLAFAEDVYGLDKTPAEKTAVAAATVSAASARR